MNVPALSAIEICYPHIAAGVCAFWNRPQRQSYLESLMFDGQGGRQRFPTDVAEEILFLYQLAEPVPGRFDPSRLAA